MLPIFTKSVDEVEPTDVEQLLKEEYPETDSVEYKGRLPHKDGEHPWYEGKRTVSYRTKRGVLKEVVAFANAEGGTLILGIEESNDQRRKATGYRLIPNCHDLADRLRKKAREHIRPILPTLSIGAVVINEAEYGGGIIIMRIPQSRRAPHRLETGQQKECYRRHSDRTEEMSMREIQELTLFRASAGDRLEKKLQKREDEFDQLYTEQKWRHLPKVPVIAFRITLVPASANLYVDDLMMEDVPPPPTICFPASYGGSEGTLRPRYEIKNFTPVLGGTASVTGRGSEQILEIHRDGLVEAIYANPMHGDDGSGPELYTVQFLGLLLSALTVAHRLRAAAGSPSAEYAMTIEIRSPSAPFKLSDPGASLDNATIESPRLVLPRRSVGNPEEFPSLARLAYRDLRNSARRSLSGEFEIEIPKQCLQPSS